MRRRPRALVVLAHLVVRWRTRDEDPFPPLEVAKVVLVGAVTTLGGLLVGTFDAVNDNLTAEGIAVAD